MVSAIADGGGYCILEGGSVYDFLGQSLIWVVNIAAVIHPLPEPLVVQAKEKT